MNRTLILIIADFLLLSLLSLARFEPIEKEVTSSTDLATVTDTMHEDLIEVLQLSLESERSNRETLNEKLSSTHEALDETREILDKTSATVDTLAAEKSALLREKEQLSAEKAAQAAALEREHARLATLAREKEAIEKAEQETRNRLDAAQEARVALNEQLTTTTQTLTRIQSEAENKREQLKATEEQLKSRDTALRDALRALESLQTEKHAIELEKARLATALAQTQKEIETVRSEKSQVQATAATLAQNVGSLAESQTHMRQELKEMQPLSLNQIFEHFQAARTTLLFSTRRSGFLGETSDTTEVTGVPVRMNGRIWIVFHRDASPLRHQNLLGLDVSVTSANGAPIAVRTIGIHANDPRIAAVELPAEATARFSPAPVELSRDPLRFPEAVALSHDGKFGEVLLKQHPEQSSYFLRDTKLLSSIPREVSARSGYFVFDKTARLFGIMIHGDYAYLLDPNSRFDTFSTGNAFSAEQWSALTDRTQIKTNKLIP